MYIEHSTVTDNLLLKCFFFFQTKGSIIFVEIIKIASTSSSSLKNTKSIIMQICVVSKNVSA